MKILDGPASATGSARGIAERITAGLDSVDHDRRRPRGGSPGGAAMTAFGWGRQRTDHTPFEGGARGLSGKRWIALCASAEAVGMTAAAVAAKLSQHVLGGQPRGWDAALALLLVVAGGLVEGAALGALQASGLRRLIPRLNRRRWLVVTAAVAGLGWAAASAPGVFSGDSGSDAEPALLVVVAAALGLGAVMGAVLGAAQAMTVRRLVPRPTRWVLANTIAWPPTMAVIFIGGDDSGKWLAHSGGRRARRDHRDRGRYSARHRHRMVPAHPRWFSGRERRTHRSPDRVREWRRVAVILLAGCDCQRPSTCGRTSPVGAGASQSVTAAPRGTLGNRGVSSMLRTTTESATGVLAT